MFQIQKGRRPLIMTFMLYAITIKAAMTVQVNRKWIKSIPVALAFVVLTALLVRLFWLQPYRDIARCMEPAVMAGDLIVVNKLAYLFKDPARGDIVFIDATGICMDDTRHARWIKRVAGLPGDRVSIHPPYVHIDGEPLVSPDVFITISLKKAGNRGYVLADAVRYPDAVLNTESDEIVLSGNEYFLLGDNAMNSFDSRHFGAVSRSNILGSVIVME
jgi:signal peptidase I